MSAMQNITGTDLLITVAVLLAIGEGIVLLGKVIDTIKNWRKPAAAREGRAETIEQHLDTDKRRLDRLDKEVADTRDAVRVLITGVNALLEHELHNGNAAQMQTASDGLKSYLINR